MGENRINPLFNVHERYKMGMIINPYRFGEPDVPWVQLVTAGGNGYPDAVITISCTEDVEIISTGNLVITGVTRTDDNGKRRHDIGISMPLTGSGNLVVAKGQKIVSLGNYGSTEPTVAVHYYPISSYSVLVMELNYNNMPINIERIMTHCYGNGNSGATASAAGSVWPSKITHIKHTNGTKFYHPSGTWPSTLKYFNNAEGYYNASVMTGSLPEGVEYFVNRRVNSGSWNYDGAMPSSLKALQLGGSTYPLCNWTGLDIPGSNNMTILSLFKFRTTKMSSADMVTLLNNLTDRVGDLPATITINDYADYASPPQSVLDAKAALIAAKTTNTVNLGA